MSKELIIKNVKRKNIFHVTYVERKNSKELGLNNKSFLNKTLEFFWIFNSIQEMIDGIQIQLRSLLSSNNIPEEAYVNILDAVTEYVDDVLIRNQKKKVREIYMFY